MASYKVLIKRSAVREIAAVPLKDRRRIVSRIEALGLDPRPAGVEKLSGDDKYRVRQGRYRILYQIQDRELVITVVKVGDRRDVYR